MLKKIAFVLFFLCFSVLASADISLIKPFSAELSPAQQIVLGKISPGETLSIIISSQSEETKWDKLRVVPSSLPENWEQAPSSFYGETIELKISVPSNAKEGTHNLKIEALNSSSQNSSETFEAVVFVKSNLLSANITNLKRSAIVGEGIEYKIKIFNDSIAEHTVIISSTLPRYWFEEKELNVLPKGTAETTLIVTPKTYGNRSFQFVLKSKLNGMEINSYKSELSIQPTIKSKYWNALYGFPVFSPTLTAYYLINSLFSLVI